MLTIYGVLVAVAVAFGVLAAYQWQRQRDATDHAALVSTQNALLAARIEALESGDERLLELALAAVEGKPEVLENERPELADTAIFAQLRKSAQDSEDKLSQYQTASGGDRGQDVPVDRGPSQPEPQQQPRPELQAQPQPEPQPEPQPQPEQTAEAPPDIIIKANEDSWVRIIDGTSGEAVFTKTLGPGESHTFTPTPGSMLITGNAGGLELSVGDVAVPPFNPKPHARREISLDPERLLAGTADQTAKRPDPAPEKTP